MTSSTLLHEGFRTGYTDLDQQSNQNFGCYPFEHMDDLFNDTNNFKLEDLMDDSSLEFDFNASMYGRHSLSSPDSMFDPHTLEPFIYQTLCADSPPFSPPHLPLNPASNQQGPPGLTHLLQDPFVELREESPYRNIPTVVQESLSEDEGEEEDDDEHAAAAAVAAAGSGYGQRHQLNASTHDKRGLPRTIYTTAKTPPAAPRRVRRRKDQLWYFLLETLGNPKYNPHFIQWENKDLGIFRFIQSKKVAQLWGAKKNRSNMSYEYFARAMRHYYSRGIMHRVAGRRLVYQFGPKAENWKNYAQLVAISASSSTSSCSSPVNANSISNTSSTTRS